jgi:hypothetical protein
VEVPEGTEAVGSMGERSEMMRRGLRENGMEPGEKKGISPARGQRSTEGTGGDVQEYLEARRAEGKQGTCCRRG